MVLAVRVVVVVGHVDGVADVEQPSLMNERCDDVHVYAKMYVHVYA